MPQGGLIRSLKFKQLDSLLDTRGLETQFIKEILFEVKRWESMPNCREPITMKMVLCMRKKYKNKHRDSLEYIMCNWIILGIFYGFGLS